MLKKLLVGKAQQLGDYDWTKDDVHLTSPEARDEHDWRDFDDSLGELRQCESESISETTEFLAPITIDVFALKEQYCMRNMLQLFE